MKREQTRIGQYLYVIYRYYIIIFIILYIIFIDIIITYILVIDVIVTVIAVFCVVVYLLFWPFLSTDSTSYDAIDVNT